MTLRPAFNLLIAAVMILAAILGLWAERSTVPLNTSNKADGYQGIWFTLNQFFEEGDKYSSVDWEPLPLSMCRWLSTRLRLSMTALGSEKGSPSIERTLSLIHI